MFGDAFSGGRVFVTGHTGFKGSWLSLWLLELGAGVTGYALDPPTNPSLFTAIGLGETPLDEGVFQDVRGDVRDGAALRAALDEAAPDVVFHLAAQPLVRRSYAEPHLTLETNVMGTVEVLEAVRLAAASGRGPRAVVVVTSDKCYENRETGQAYVEGDALGGWDVYSASKACDEIVCDAYRRSFFAAPEAPRLVTARAGNVIGGGDWSPDRLIADCVRALTAGQDVELRNPEAVRPWQHVLECLSGYLWLAASLLEGRDAGDGVAASAAWNFGPGAEARSTVREVVESFLAAWGGGAWRPAPGAAEQPHEAGLLTLDAGKAARELGWRPVWDAEMAVQRTAHWYARHAEGATALELRGEALEDVAAYVESARDAGVAWVR